MHRFMDSGQLYYLIIPQTVSGQNTDPGFRCGEHFPALRKSLLITLICLSAITYSHSQTLTPTFNNVDYVGNNVANQKMDIYIPPGLTSPAPVIVFIHGGGWSGGS